MLSRVEVQAAVSKYYTEVMKGKCWCLWDDAKRKYEIRGERVTRNG